MLEPYQYKAANETLDKLSKFLGVGFSDDTFVEEGYLNQLRAIISDSKPVERGELSELDLLRHYARGLEDRDNPVSSVIWPSTNQRLEELLREGLQLKAEGRLNPLMDMMGLIRFALAQLIRELEEGADN